MILVFKFPQALIKIRVVDGVFSMCSPQTNGEFLCLEELAKASGAAAGLVAELKRNCEYMSPEELRLYLIGECAANGGLLVGEE